MMILRSLLVPNFPLNCVPNNLLRQLLTSTVDGEHLQPPMQSRSHSFIINNYSLRVHSTGTLQLSVNVGGSSQIARSQVSTDSMHNPTFDKKLLVNSSSESLEILGMEDDKEIERRRKIGVANKGKRPWNKGRKHSAETRERIKQRTIEALSDPKVRKKMSERPCDRAHSDEIKIKIGVSQRLVWKRRLKLKSVREKAYVIWAEGIAEAAKRGGFEQQELEWDSLKKLEAEVARQQVEWVADKARKKEMAKLRAAREKAEKMVKRGEKMKEKEKKAKAREEMKRRGAKLKEEKKEGPISKGLKLKARITKMRRKKRAAGEVAINGDMTTSVEPAIEKLDLELIKREKLRREVSLADEIQAAKKKRAESAAAAKSPPKSRTVGFLSTPTKP